MKTHFPSLFPLSAAPCAFERGVMSEAFSIDEGGVAKVFNEEVAAGVFFEELAQQPSPVTGGAPFPLQGMGQIARGVAALTFGGAGQGREATGAEKAGARYRLLTTAFPRVSLSCDTMLGAQSANISGNCRKRGNLTLNSCASSRAASRVRKTSPLSKSSWT